MRNRKLTTLALAATAVTGVLVIAPAASAAALDSAGVTTTFTVTGGALSIASAATTANLGSSTSTVTGTTVTGALPKVTISDTRASLLGWTSKIASTDFSDGATPAHTVVASKAVAYVPAGSGPTLESGSAVATTTALAAGTGVPLGTTAATLVSATTVGSNQVSYTPTVQVTIDSTVLAATYSGTITHSVV